MTTLSPPAYLSRASLAHELDIAESTVDEMVKRGVLPPPVRLSTGCVRWCWADIVRAMDSLKDGQAAGRPADPLGEGYIDEGGFNIRQQKTNREIWCPIDDALAAEMSGWERSPGSFLRQSHGKIYSRKLLDSQFNEARARIPELAGATFHGLRGTRVVELRRAGLTPLQIQDQIGMSIAMIERYCRFADRKLSGKASVVALAERRNKNV